MNLREVCEWAALCVSVGAIPGPHMVSADDCPFTCAVAYPSDGFEIVDKGCRDEMVLLPHILATAHVLVPEGWSADSPILVVEKWDWPLLLMRPCST